MEKKEVNERAFTSIEDAFIRNKLLKSIEMQIENDIPVNQIDINFTVVLQEFLDQTDGDISPAHLLNNIQCQLRREATVLELSRSKRAAIAIASVLIQSFVGPIQETTVKEALFASHPSMSH